MAKQKRQKIAPQAHSTVFFAPNMLSPGSGTVRKRLGRVPGTLLDVSRPSVARPGRPKIGLGASFGLLQIVPSAFGRVPDTAVGAQDGPRLIFRQFLDERAWIFIDFDRFFGGFRSSCLRRNQNRKLKKESCDPCCPTWLLRCAFASYCSCIFGNAIRT